jgi:hypothetical protein
LQNIAHCRANIANCRANIANCRANIDANLPTRLIGTTMYVREEAVF